MSEQASRQQDSVVRENPSRYNVSAKFYDLEYGQLTGAERELYLALASQQAGPILELGCGTGRVALPLAEAGHKVTALDLSEHMLAEFQRKLKQAQPQVQQRVTVRQGSMDDFQLEERFKLITMPFRAFQHLLSVDQQRRCLGLVREHLAEDGVFVFNVFNPNLKYIVERMRHSKMWLEDKALAKPEGGQLRRSYRVQHNPASQTMKLAFRFEDFDLGGRLGGTELEEMELRWLYRFEAEYLFELCRLKIVAAYGGYDKRPLDEQATELIYLLRRAD